MKSLPPSPYFDEIPRHILGSMVGAYHQQIFRQGILLHHPQPRLGIAQRIAVLRIIKGTGGDIREYAGVGVFDGNGGRLDIVKPGQERIPALDGIRHIRLLAVGKQQQIENAADLLYRIRHQGRRREAVDPAG